MTFRLAKSDRGIALIIVMIIVAALTVIVTGFAYSMRVETKLARNTRFNPDMDWLGRSGVELARFLLSKRAHSVCHPSADVIKQRVVFIRRRFLAVQRAGCAHLFEPAFTYCFSFCV